MAMDMCVPTARIRQQSLHKSDEMIKSTYYKPIDRGFTGFVKPKIRESIRRPTRRIRAFSTK